jgi:CheY-like chemotaxis protein
MSYVLAIEPHPEQARILRDSVAARAGAKLRVVGSLDAAIRAIDKEVPNLVLVSPLMPSREEYRLVQRLRSLLQSPAPQILIIPDLACTDDDVAPKRTLLDRLRNKKMLPHRCSPSAFADDVAAYIPLVWPCEPAPVRTPPPDARGLERREMARFERIDAAKIIVNGAVAAVVDLSLTGAQVLAPHVLLPGVGVRVSLSRKTMAVSCDADIVWGSIDLVGATRELRYRAGIKFTEPDRHALGLLYSGEFDDDIPEECVALERRITYGTIERADGRGELVAR